MKIHYPFIILIGGIMCLLAYGSPNYVYFLPVMSQVFGFGIFSCLSMLKSQRTQGQRIIVYTLIALNCSNIILILSNNDLYFESHLIIIPVGVALAWYSDWNNNCKKCQNKSEPL